MAARAQILDIFHSIRRHAGMGLHRYSQGESSMRSNLRSLLLCGVAATAIAAAAPEAAQAQMYSSGPGFYVSAEGRYLMNEGGKVPNYAYAYNFSNGGYEESKTNAENGWGGKVMLGYRFGNNWDVGVGISGGWLKGKDSANGVEQGGVSGFNEKLKVELDYQTVDFEAGYNFAMGPGTTLRLFGGLRFANFNQKATGEGASTNTLAYDYTFDAKRKTKYWGIGPRIGANGQVGLGGGFHMFGGVSGALLFGKFNDKHNFETNNLAGTFPRFYSYNDKKKSKMVPNVAGEIGLGYQFGAGTGSTVSIQAGYGGEAFFGAGSKGYVQAYIKDSDSTDYVMHGPFVRLTATFGPAVMAAVAPPPAPPPAMVPKKNFLVFFDFDRSNITADAQKVITEAAAAAKAGNVSRIQLTGHTDRSGSDQYNMALSLRRGEAVKQALIRLGIPAASIAVIGRGESQPLVPTADGVREPQNRRVEILL